MRPCSPVYSRIPVVRWAQILGGERLLDRVLKGIIVVSDRPKVKLGRAVIGLCLFQLENLQMRAQPFILKRSNQNGTPKSSPP